MRGPQKILNFWATSALKVEVEKLPPGSWKELLEFARQRSTRIIFGRDIEEQLRPSPYNLRQAENVLELLNILQQIALGTLPDGSLNPTSMELMKKFFQGASPAFTDESDSNKRTFAKDLLFADPAGGHEMLSCSWHGKISLGFFRLHFEWPRPRGQQEVKVVYIGPKLTKH